MPHDEGSLAATTAIIRTLARGDPTAHLDVSRLGIPGANSPEKKALERELVTLINRVRSLEISAAAAAIQPHHHTALPEAPSDPARATPASTPQETLKTIHEEVVNEKYTNGNGEINGNDDPYGQDNGVARLPQDAKTEVSLNELEK